jgi:hypothetical protein
MPIRGLYEILPAGRIRIGAVTWERAISDLPHVFWDGRIIIQTYCTWLALKKPDGRGNSVDGLKRGGAPR